MLNPSVKTKWLAALRSGTYTQTTGQLHVSGGYCCLGILCVVKGFKLKNGTFPTVNDGGELTKMYCKKIGLPYYLERKLVEMNDREENFLTIADFIEKCEEI